MKYDILVGNLGLVGTTDNHEAAVACFDSYVQDSESRYARVNGESVWLIEDGELIKEHQGANDIP